MVRIMTVDEVKALPTAEKLQIMEIIWDDLRGRLQEADIPLRIKELLDARRARVAAGTSKILDWDSVKERIGKP